MAKHDELIIEPRENGQWAVLKPHAERASFLAQSCQEAVAYAMKLAPEGDIKLKGVDGKFTQLQKPKK